MSGAAGAGARGGGRARDGLRDDIGLVGRPIQVSVLGGEKARPLPARFGLVAASLALLFWAPWQIPKAHAAREAASIRAALPSDFREIAVGPFALFTDASSYVTTAAQEALELSAREFAAWASALGLPLEAPRGPLRVVLFSRHSDFLAFAREEDGIDASWMGGYYAALTNRVVLYDDADSPEYRALLARCPGDHSGRALRENVLADARRATSRKTLHEVAHLLSFNTGLQARASEYPLWLTEGLAEAFVVDTIGPDRDAPDRARPASRELLTLGCSGGLHRADFHDLYGQSRALVASLRATAPERLGRCLEAFRVAPAGADPLALAERSLGPWTTWGRPGEPVIAGAPTGEP